MPRYSTAFGMDVHLRSTTVCALDAETGEAVTRRFRGNPWGEVAEWMSGFPGPSLAAYESGYLGFAPQRELSGLGVDCVVAAVSRVPRSAADLVSVNIIFTISTNAFSPIAPTRIRRIRQRGCAAFGA